ncbi:hypothetical protein [Psychrobacter sp. 72-O-c]|uniref:hypothetical protein n=1 Tax=Psychrobacter sp. 72-O-c TaxID=2774125 RepID=UPI001919A362|nr:hypothetical protein [Psychrobacter sp. 72-O-c]
MLFLNQAFMMLWEAILENATLVSALLLILLAAWIYWAVAGRHKKLAYGLAGILASAIAVVGFFTLPLFFNASLGDLTYWVDWAFHLVMVVALLVYAYVVMLPLVTGLTGSIKRRV